MMLYNLKCDSPRNLISGENQLEILYLLSDMTNIRVAEHPLDRTYVNINPQ